VGEKKWCLHHGSSNIKFVVGHEGCLHLFVSENEPVVNETVACNCGMNCTVVNEVVARNFSNELHCGGVKEVACHNLKPTQLVETDRLRLIWFHWKQGGFLGLPGRSTKRV
jgi:hypothetical protein